MRVTIQAECGRRIEMGFHTPVTSNVEGTGLIQVGLVLWARTTSSATLVATALRWAESRNKVLAIVAICILDGAIRRARYLLRRTNTRLTQHVTD